jgi:hypothetical protein
MAQGLELYTKGSGTGMGVAEAGLWRLICSSKVNTWEAADKAVLGAACGRFSLP